MPYQHDVFISYKRETNWTPWTRQHFVGLLKSYLHQDLSPASDIYIDEHLESDFGADWVRELAEHLATSRIAVILFSRDYFFSNWCLCELDLMLERVDQLSTPVTKPRLVIPVIAHDGDLIPDEIDRTSSVNISKYRIACMMQNTEDYHEFSKLIKIVSPKVAQAVNAVPDFKSSWISKCRDRFEETYEAEKKGVRYKPRNFKLKLPVTLRSPPRLIVR